MCTHMCVHKQTHTFDLRLRSMTSIEHGENYALIKLIYVQLTVNLDVVEIAP